jgi:putative tryptophan/tyrosine transport system substrate-binding protein
VKRRDFITLLGGAAAWPLAARGQQPTMPAVGFLGSSSAAEWLPFVNAFQRGLKETGYIEGENFTIEYRWADGQYDRLPALAADLVRRQVAVIFAAGSPVPALAAKAATATIPIVFALGIDPVQFGLVASLNRPGGNITGVNFLVGHLTEKALGLIHELIPNVAVAGMFVNPNNPNADSVTRNARETARSLSLQLHILNAGTTLEIDAAFAGLVEQRIGMLLSSADPFFMGRRDQFVALAARHAVPTIYFAREFVTAGGLMSYGTSISDAYRRAGVYTGKILKGARPADLPIEQSTRFEFAINLTTAKTLGLQIPDKLLALADEVIE